PPPSRPGGLPPRGVPNAPRSAAWAVAGRALTGQRAMRTPTTWATTPRPVDAPAPAAMTNQSTLDIDVQEYTVPVNRLRATACNERPQQRLENFGATALSD